MKGTAWSKTSLVAIKIFYMRKLIKYLIIIAFIFTCLPACTSTTSPGSIGINRSQLMLVPAKEIENLSSESFRALNNHAKAAGALVYGPELDNLHRIAKRLIAVVDVFRTDALEWNWQISLINSKEINAFCMPGGKILFTTGIIQNLDLTDDEVAAIMGHEIAHALREHSREQISQQVGLELIYALLNAAATAKGVTPLDHDQWQQGMNLLVAPPHSRKQEIESDKIGLELMARAGYNPDAAVNVWKKMQAIEKKPEKTDYLSTHPSHINRIKVLQSLMPIAKPLYENSYYYVRGKSSNIVYR
jgi:predicted Zn-dependent protease